MICRLRDNTSAWAAEAIVVTLIQLCCVGQLTGQGQRTQVLVFDRSLHAESGIVVIHVFNSHVIHFTPKWAFVCLRHRERRCVAVAAAQRTARALHLFLMVTWSVTDHVLYSGSRKTQTLFRETCYTCSTPAQAHDERRSVPLHAFHNKSPEHTLTGHYIRYISLVRPIFKRLCLYSHTRFGYIGCAKLLSKNVKIYVK